MLKLDDTMDIEDDQHLENGYKRIDDGGGKVYNLRNVSAPVFRGVNVWIFAKFLRTPIGGLVIKLLKRMNDIDCVKRLVEGTLKDSCMPMYYPFPENKDEMQYKKHSDLSKTFDLQEFILSNNVPIESSEEFRYWTIHDYITMYQNQEITPYQVTTAVCKAVFYSNNRSTGLNAIVVVNEGDLFELAKQSTERYRNGNSKGMLDGIPVVIKDEVDVQGYQTTKGTTFLGNKNGVAKKDCDTVAKLRQAGALIVGKTNMHEIGIGTTGFNRQWGLARNPHEPGHYTGGSSSGSAAAVAAGIVPLALAVDAGGSIRIPASLCGIVGLKATFNRVAMDLDSYPSAGHVGPVAATVKDAAIGYAIMAGDEAEPIIASKKQVQSPHGPDPPLHLASFSKNQNLCNVKIGIYEEFFNHADPEIVEVCSKAVRHMESLGAQVVKIAMPHMEEMKVAHLITVLTEIASEAGKYQKDISKLTPDTQIAMEYVRSMDSHSFLAAQKVRRYAMRVLDDVFSKVDVLVTPGTGSVAPPIHNSVKKHGENNMEQTSNLMRFITQGNLCGIPGITVPVGYSNEKRLPISLLIQARHWEEDMIIRLARSCEAMVSHRRPKIYYDIIEMAKKEARE